MDKITRSALDGDVKAIQEYLTSKPDINAFNEKGWTLLGLVCTAKKNSAKLAHMVLTAGANPNLSDRAGRYSPIHIAILLKNERLLDVLLHHGANPNIKVRETTPLDITVRNSEFKMTQKLLESGASADLNSGRNGYAPIHKAVRMNDIKMVDLLFDYCGTFSLTDQKGLTPYDYANEEMKKYMRHLEQDYFMLKSEKMNNYSLKLRKTIFLMNYRELKALDYIEKITNNQNITPQEVRKMLDYRSDQCCFPGFFHKKEIKCLKILDKAFSRYQRIEKRNTVHYARNTQSIFGNNSDSQSLSLRVNPVRMTCEAIFKST